MRPVSITDQDSGLPIPRDCKITRIMLKYTGQTGNPFTTSGPGSSYDVDITTLTNPNAAIDTGLTVLSASVVQLVYADTLAGGGLGFPFKDSGALAVNLSQGDLLVITGEDIVGAVISTGEECVVQVEFESR